MKKHKTLTIIFLVCTLFLIGCVKTKSERNISFDMTELDHAELVKECAEITSNGDILGLLSEIKSDTQEIFNLISTPNPTISEAEVSRLADGIADKSKKIMVLSKSEWTMSKWKHEINWRIDEEDFKKAVGTYFKNGFELKDHKIHSIYFMGERRDDLKERVSFSKDKNILIATFKNHGSALEICQLQKTLSIVLEVKFRSVKAIKQQYFNLTVQNDLEGSL